MGNAFQLKIELVDIEPLIWRRVVVPFTLTLLELHAVIQGAMGWQDYHLHMFELGGERYEIPEEGVPPEGADSLDERQYRLGDLLSEGMEVAYVYDFGDDWLHRIVVEEVTDHDLVTDSPLCIGGERACPPEDCGGPYGYMELLEVLANPDHPDHQEMTEWAEGFEPEPFNPQQANGLIAAVLAMYRERGWGFES